MPETGNAPAKDAQNGEFVTCKCEKDCCVPRGSAQMKVGKMWASALTGFIAGAAVATIILLPWLVFEGKMSTPLQRIPPAPVQDLAPSASNTPAAPADQSGGTTAGTMVPAPAPANAPAPAPTGGSSGTGSK